MKKILFGIFSIILGFIGFGFCDTVENLLDYVDSGTTTIPANTIKILYNVPSNDYGVYCINVTDFQDEYWSNNYLKFGMNNVSSLPAGNYLKIHKDQVPATVCVIVNQPYIFVQNDYINYPVTFSYKIYRLDELLLTTIPFKSLTVYYNNGNSTETITCDGTQAIEIQGLSTITSTNTFTPYFNIDYIDEDNQKLTESYSKDILYLLGSTFKKTYTGNNERILTSQGGNSESIFTGYLPTFDVNGSVDPNDEFTGNVFNNFADNSLKVLLSNIPSYIQYVILFALLFFILGFIRKFKRR